LWWIPVGEVAENIRDHPATQGIDLSRAGGGGLSIQMVAGDLLYTTEGANGPPVLNAWDKMTGDFVGTVEMPGTGQYGMMTYSHEGVQHVVVQVGRAGRLVALRLPE